MKFLSIVFLFYTISLHAQVATRSLLLDYIQKESSKVFTLEFNDGEQKKIHPPYLVKSSVPQGNFSRSDSYYTFSFFDDSGAKQERTIIVTGILGEEGFSYVAPDGKKFHVDKLKDLNGNNIFANAQSCDYLERPNMLTIKTACGKDEVICLSNKLSPSCKSESSGRIISVVCKAVASAGIFSCPAVKDCALDNSVRQLEGSEVGKILPEKLQIKSEKPDNVRPQ